MKRSRIIGLSTLLSVLMLSSSIFPTVMMSGFSSSVGNTGFEPWYYYIGGMVNSATGNLHFTARDISFKTRWLDIEIVRAYNSHRNGTATGFGFGWTFNYDVHLVESGAIVSLVEGDGSVHNFTEIGGGRYSPPPGVHSRLMKNVDVSFTLWFKDGSKHNFNSTGRLLAIIDKNDNNLTFTYTDGKLTRVEDNSGLALTLNYNPQNRISSVVDPLNRQIIYEYDVSGNLIEVIDALGHSTLYFYGNGHRIEAVVNPIGRVLAFSYTTQDGVDRVDTIGNSQYNFTAQTYYPPFQSYYIEYNTTLNVVTVIKRLLHVITIKLNDVGNPLELVDPLGGVTSMSWDSNMNMVAFTDANGYQYLYEFDGFGDLMNRTDPLGHFTIYGWNNTDTEARYMSLLMNVTDALGNVTSYDYDERGNMVKTTDAVGNSLDQYYDSFGNLIRRVDFRGFETLYSYNSHGYMVNSTDALGNVTRYYYDDVGRLTNVTDSLGFTASYEYDANDRNVKVIDATGNMTGHNYDALGNLVSTVDANTNAANTTVHEYIDEPSGVVDATGNSTSYNYDPKGNLASVIDARGYRASNTTYDALDRVVSVTDALGNTESCIYDAVGNILTKTDKRGYTTTYVYDALNRIIRVSDPLGYNTTFWYDALGRLVNVTDARGYSTTYVYDALSRLIRVIDAAGNVTIQAYDANGNLISETNARGFETTYEYDALNRLTSEIDPLEYSTDIHYDAVGNMIEVIDARGYATTYEYDALNRLTKVTDPLGNATRYFYDAVGNQICIIDANGYETKYEYDTLNRLINITDALNYTSLYSYDAVGNMLTIADANGNVTRWEYDALNRPTRIITPIGYEIEYSYDVAGNILERIDANGNVTSYGYDASNHLTLVSYMGGGNVTFQFDATGKIVEASNVGIGLNDTTYYSYDNLDRVVSVTVDYGGFVKTNNYTYDECGNRETMIDPDGGVTTYAYDAVNQLTRITDPFSNVTTFEYDSTGRRTGVRYPNRVVSACVYDATDNLLNMTTRKSNGAIISSYAYLYDDVGNRLEMTEYAVGITAYEYDALYRLAKVVYPSGEDVQYAYDGVGNRLTQVANLTSTITYTYDSDNRLLSADGTAYSYDNNGNLITKSNVTETTYYYDHENRLVKVILPDSSEVFFQYSPFGDRSSISNGGETNHYFYDSEDILMELNETGEQKARYTHGPMIDEPISMVRTENVSYYHFDCLGSVTAVTGISQNLTATYKYDVFGKTVSTTGTLENPYRFTGREYDNETGLYFFRARYYDTRIGRFISKDLQWMFQVASPYVYASNNPVNLVDPFGLHARERADEKQQKIKDTSKFLAWSGLILGGIATIASGGTLPVIWGIVSASYGIYEAATSSWFKRVMKRAWEFWKEQATKVAEAAEEAIRRAAEKAKEAARRAAEKAKEIAEKAKEEFKWRYEWWKQQIKKLPIICQERANYPPTRDGALLAIGASETTVTVTIKNEGESPETFVVSTSYTLRVDPPIGTQNAILASGANTTLTFPWTPVQGRYQVHAEIVVIPDESDTADNAYTITELIGIQQSAVKKRRLLTDR